MLSRLLWEPPSRTLTPAEGEGLVHKSPVRVWQFILPVLIGAGPLLAWSAHNSRNYDFFGISDYGGEILYDGWIYFGESSRIAITDQNSPAILTIHAAYQSGSVTGSKIPTGWDIYHSLRVHGYTSEQAFSLLQQAAFDSIRKDLSVTWRVLVIKIREGFEPHTFIPATFTLPVKPPWPGAKRRLL